MPSNGIVTQSCTDWRFYPSIKCAEHPTGLLYLSRGKRIISFRTSRAAQRYLERLAAQGKAVCPVHGI